MISIGNAVIEICSSSSQNTVLSIVNTLHFKNRISHVCKMGHNATFCPPFVTLLPPPQRCSIGVTVAGRFWVSERTRHEWHGVTGRAPSSNIHLSTRTLWISEKSLTDSLTFCSCLFLQPNQFGIYGYELATILILYTSPDAVNQIGLWHGTCGEKEQELEAVVLKSIGVLWFLPVHTPTSCLITLSVWCDVQTCIMSYRESDQLIWCTVFSWFKEAGFSYFSYIQRLTLSAAFIYYAHRSSLWCQPGHYLWQCLVRLPLPLI